MIRFSLLIATLAGLQAAQAETTVRIRNMHTGEVLHMEQAGEEETTAVGIGYLPTRHQSTHWILEDVSNGTHTLVNRWSGHRLVVGLGTVIQARRPESPVTRNAYWRLETDTDQVTRLTPAHHPGRMQRVTGQSKLQLSLDPAPTTAWRLDPVSDQPLQPADWTKNLSVYQVNTRAFSQAGTFAEVQQALPRLRKMGAGILWLMPIHPIGAVARKGSLGSPYAVVDYLGVNPEFGTQADLRTLVDRAHELGMYVILDWVANHTAHDHPWTQTHPEYYHKDAQGDFISPGGWSDVLHLNFASPDLRREMAAAMRYWVEEFDIDGFRCDVAGMVPLDFWEAIRADLDRIKPIFLLAEDQGARYHRAAFDMTYAFPYHTRLQQVTESQTSVDPLHELYQAEQQVYPGPAYRMLYTSNHDENAWIGTVFERYGEAAEVCMVFCCVFDGMPLIYNGQEVGLSKRLEFFEKDFIPWQKHRFQTVLEKLLNLKQQNQALWNGTYGGDVERIPLPESPWVYAFHREKNGDRVLAVCNFSENPTLIDLAIGAGTSWTDVMTGASQTLSADKPIPLPGWGYQVLHQEAESEPASR